MSRSYKEPWVTDNGPHTKWAKRLANKKVRKFVKFLLNNTIYKKIFCSWDICDYKFYLPEKEEAYRK